MAINKNKAMEVAQKFVEKGQLDKAIKEYLKILEEDPKDVRVWLKLGDLYAKKNAKQEATDTYLRVAQFYGDQGFYLKAVAVYKQVLKLDPRLIEVNIKLAEVYRQLGLLSDAMQQYELVAAFYHREGKPREALATIRELVELDPENVATRIKLAELYSKEQMVKEAVAEFSRAAETLRASGRMDDFVKVAERLVWHQPDNHAMNRELAQLYLRRGDPRHALQKLQACFKADPRDVETLGMLAAAFLALDQKSKTVSVWKEIARIHIENNQSLLAAEIYRRILAVDPDDADALAASGGRRAVGTGDEPAVTARSSPPTPRSPAPVSRSAGPAPARSGSSLPMAPSVSTGRVPSRATAPVGSGASPKPVSHAPAPPAELPPPPPGLVARPGVGRSTGPTARISGPAPVAPPPAAPPPVAARVPVLPSIPSLPVSPPPPLDFSDGVAVEIDEEREPTSRATERIDETMVDAEREFGLDEVSDVRDRQAELVAKLLSEADVYVKYGIKEKAVEHLQRVFDTDPRNVEARERLKDVLLALGRPSDAAEQLAKLVELCGAVRPPSQAEGWLRELGALVPGDPRVRELAQRFRLKMPATPMPAIDEEDGQEVDSDDIQIESDAAEPPAGGAGSIDEPLDRAPREAAGFADDGTVEIDPAELAVEIGDPEDGALDTDLAFDDVSATAANDKTYDSMMAPSVDDLDGLPVGADGEAAEKEFSLDPTDEAMAESLGVSPPPGGPQAAGPGTGAQGAAATSLEDDLDEADFFVSQNLFEEARAILGDLLLRHPGHPLIAAKLRDVERAGAGPSQSAARVAPPAASPAPRGEIRRKPAVIAKGLAGPDVDTHYDLGLAYKEMGLYDEAIKEFALVRTAPGRAAQCYMMIGLCQAERGKLAEAVEEFKAGLYVENINEREALALYFELGAAYQALGDQREALYYFEKVYKRDPAFRDAERRVESLRRGAPAAPGGAPASLPRSNGARARAASDGAGQDDSADEALRAIDSLGDPGDVPP